VELEPFLQEVATWARGRADVHAVVLVGSQARTELPADEFSDVDLVLVVDDPAPFTGSADWLEPFGRPLLTVVEPTAVGPLLERRTLFESGLEVDFALVPADAVRALLAEPEVGVVFARGYRVLEDELELEDDLARAAHAEPAPRAEADLARLSQDFWYHVLWTAKKLRRGELYVAKQACDCYLKALLIGLLVEAVRARDSGADTWHRARFLERWAAPADVDELRQTYAMYDADAVARALRATARMFHRLEQELGRTEVDHAEVFGRLDALLGA
jgi:aminoglycoside 6-adenylyltransferase